MRIYRLSLGKRYILIFLLLLINYSVSIVAQYETSVDITNCSNENLKKKIDNNTSKLLTEMTMAQNENRAINLSDIDIEKSAVSSLMSLWEICPFRCDETEIVERCLNTSKGYQIRNIPIVMVPLQGEKFEEDEYQEFVVNYNNEGRIVDVYFSINTQQYQSVMRSNLEVQDLRRRQLVLDFVEQFRTAYNRKDMPYLQDVYSDDALIITGTVIKRKSNDGVAMLKPEIKYTQQTKQQYLAKLAKIFENKNSRLNILFDNIKVNKHRTLDNIYGVTLVQKWNSGTYSDEGYLFLLWDFTDEEKHQIHVRTWQPLEDTPKEEVFGLGSFSISLNQ